MCVKIRSVFQASIGKFNVYDDNRANIPEVLQTSDIS